MKFSNVLQATIPGNQRTEAKTFKVGEVYLANRHSNYNTFGEDVLIEITHILYGKIHWRDIFRGRTGYFTTKQFTSLSKYAQLVSSSEGKRMLIKYIFNVGTMSFLTD